VAQSEDFSSALFTVCGGWMEKNERKNVEKENKIDLKFD
jgi:hypothetical protein